MIGYVWLCKQSPRKSDSGGGLDLRFADPSDAGIRTCRHAGTTMRRSTRVWRWTRRRGGTEQELAAANEVDTMMIHPWIEPSSAMAGCALTGPRRSGALGRPAGTPAARSSLGPLPDARLLAALRRGSPFFSQQVFQRGIVEHGIAKGLVRRASTSSRPFRRFGSLTSMPP